MVAVKLLASIKKTPRGHFYTIGDVCFLICITSLVYIVLTFETILLVSLYSENIILHVLLGYLHRTPPAVL